MFLFKHQQILLLCQALKGIYLNLYYLFCIILHLKHKHTLRRIAIAVYNSIIYNTFLQHKHVQCTFSLLSTKFIENFDTVLGNLQICSPPGLTSHYLGLAGLLRFICLIFRSRSLHIYCIFIKVYFWNLCGALFAPESTNGSYTLIGSMGDFWFPTYRHTIPHSHPIPVSSLPWLPPIHCQTRFGPCLTYSLYLWDSVKFSAVWKNEKWIRTVKIGTSVV